MNTIQLTPSRRASSRAVRFGAVLAALAAGFVAVPVLAADVNVSVRIGDPMYYGRIDLGGPPPPVIYRRPVVIMPAPRPEPPVYLRVPPGHAKNWSRHCGRYDACGRQVYFVQDGWYRNVYVPSHRDHRGDDGARGHDDRRGDDRGKGNGNGKGHGHDKGKHRD